MYIIVIHLDEFTQIKQQQQQRLQQQQNFNIIHVFIQLLTLMR